MEDAYQSLLDLSTLLLAADDTSSAADAVLHKLVAISGADRGYIVVREQGELSVKRDIRFRREEVSQEERRISRRLVRRVVETKTPFVSDDVLSDGRISPMESLERAGTRAVLVVPLASAGEVWGVLYLDRTANGARFDAEAVRLATDVAALAGQVLRRAIEREALQERMRTFEKDLLAQHDFQGIVTQDDGMRSALATVAQVAPSDVPVLVLGETGTGKELVARAVHANSKRAQRPFVALHCAALPASLLESELFGHSRGAFTGAERDRTGRVAAAHGGTLFLDEIGEIPLEVQAKLLRFLQFGEVSRVGSDRVEKVDVRVVSATHRSLKGMIEAGKFRQDLYYRLNVVQVTIPPLRERLNDIPLLVEAFLRGPGETRAGETRAGETQAAPGRFSQKAMALLLAYDYPGNVRELQHIVERAKVLATESEFGVSLLPSELVPVAEPAAGEDEDAAAVPTTLARVRAAAVTAAEKAFLVGILERAGGNISGAARASGLHRSYLQRLMSKHGLRAG